MTNAAKWGAKAILIFNDPKDFAPVPDDQLYPKTWWLPRSGVQRGSVLLGTGDPLTPRYPAKGKRTGWNKEEENWFMSSSSIERARRVKTL